MDKERLKRAGAGAVSALLFAAAMFGFRTDPEDDLARMWQALTMNPVPTVLLILALAIAVVVWWPRLLRLVGIETAGSVKARLTRWLMRAGYQVGDEEQGDNDIELHVRDHQSRRLVVVMPKRENAIYVAAIFRFLEEDAALIEQVDRGQDGGLLHALKMEMARKGTRYMGIGHPMTHVQLHVRVPVSAGEDAFLEALHEVRDSYVLFQQVALRAVRQTAREAGAAAAPEPVEEGTVLQTAQPPEAAPTLPRAGTQG